MKVIVTGASGFLGGHIADALSKFCDVIGTYNSSSPAEIHKTRLRKLDITDRDSVIEFFRTEKPDAVIHTAAITSITSCASQPDLARQINVDGTSNIAEASSAIGAYLIHFSTDMVFDGEGAPYSEAATPRPLSVYGATKLESEAKFPPGSLVLRLALAFGRSLNPGRATFFEDALRKLKSGEEAGFFNDEWRTPLWAGDLKHLISLFLDSKPTGLLHVGGPERMTRLDMAVRACKTLGIVTDKIKSLSRSDIPGPARPRDLTLDTSKLNSLFPTFRFTKYEEAVQKY